MIQLQNVRMSYSVHQGLLARATERTVIRDLSLTIRPGERVALLGVNGAGKTTLIKLMLGIIQPVSGQITLEGHPSSRYPDPLKSRFNALFAQKSQLWWSIPVRDSLEILGLTYGISPDGIRERMTELATVFAIGELLDRPPRFLSFGQRLRCELVATLLTRPEYLFLDEPFIGLDFESRQTLTHYLGEYLHRHGTTLVIASHDLDCIGHLAERVVIIDGQALALDGSLAELNGAGAQGTAVELEFAGEPDPAVLLKLNSLHPVFPEAAWECRRERNHHSITLRLPTREPSHLYFIHEFARETMGCHQVSFRNHATLEEILDQLREDPAGRRRRLQEALLSPPAGERDEDCMLRLLQVRGELSRETVNRADTPDPPGIPRETLDEWATEFLRQISREERLRVRTFQIGLLAAFRGVSAPDPRHGILRCLNAALQDADPRLRATAVETAGVFLLTGREKGLDDGTLATDLTTRIREGLAAEDRRIRTNAFLINLRLSRGEEFVALLRRLTHQPALYPGFPWLLEILTLQDPFLRSDRAADWPGLTEAVQELLIVCIRQRIGISPNTINRCLSLLYEGRPPREEP